MAKTQRLEDMPNIGKSIAADLRTLGIADAGQLAARRPLDVYLALAPVMAHRHDPCVLYTLLAAQHFLKTGEPRPWWSFTQEGKQMLAAHAEKNLR